MACCTEYYAMPTDGGFLCFMLNHWRYVWTNKSFNEDAQWHNCEDVKKALTFAEYEKAKRTNALKINQICKGVEKGQSISADLNVQSGEPALIFVPGPFAIAHHLISSWTSE